jgi:P27 family predicted phage terminase small subunit
MPGVKGQRSGGHNAKTQQAHGLAGTTRKDRHSGYCNPDPPKGRPEAPKELSGEALSEWNRMIVRLETAGTLATVDDAVIYQYCRLFAETEQAAVSREESAASVDLLEDNLSDLKGSDLVQCFQEISKMRQLEARYTSQIRQGRMSLRAYLVEMGMTPASRGRVKLPEHKPVDPFDEFDGAVN